MFCLLTRFSVPPYRGASDAPAVGAGDGDEAMVGLAVGNGGAVGAMAGCRVAGGAVGLGAGVGNGIVVVGIGIGGAVGAMAGCCVADVVAGAGLAGAGNASPSSEHATAAAAIAASVRIIRNEWMIGRR